MSASAVRRREAPAAVPVWPVVRLALWTWLAVLGSAVALGPLTQSQRFLVVGGLAAGLVVATGVALRLLRVAWPVVAVVQVVVLVLWGTWTFARGEATLGVLPNADVVRVWEQMLQSTVEHSQTYPAPVPRLVAFESTVAWAVGGLALVADVLVAGLRRAPLVGLLFLAVYMAPVSVLSGDVSVFAFIPGALGYVFLLVAAHRDESARWGRDLDDVAGVDVRRGAALSAVGQKAGLGAIACAVVLPVIVPTLPATYFGTGGTGGEGSGSGAVRLEDPTQDVRRNLGEQSREVLARVTTTTGTPSYLRIAALTDFDDDGWSPGAREDEDLTSLENVLPSVPGQNGDVAVQQVSYEAEVTDRFSTKWLPVTYAPSSIEVDGSWRLDNKNFDVLSRDETRSDFRYRFSSALPQPTRAQLRAAIDPTSDVEDELDLDRDAPDVIAETAEEVTAGADNDFDRAAALQRWFRQDGGFTYDLESREGGSAYDTLESFLTDDRRGYCEQFAGAMAAMARSVGIPARVAVGFLRPERDGDTFVFRGTSMHAWPELYFENVGWVQFEPTPGGTDYSTPDFDAAAPTTGPTDEATESAPTTGPTSERTRETAGPIQADAGGTDGTDWGATLLTTGGVLLGGALVVMLPLLGSLLLHARRRRAATTASERAEATWGRFLDRARDLGLSWDATLTPRGIGRTLGHRLPPDPDVRAALDRLVQGIERARYARSYNGSDLEPEALAVERGLATGRPRARRWRARLVPLAWASSWRTARRAAPRRGLRTSLLDLREQD